MSKDNLQRFIECIAQNKVAAAKVQECAAQGPAAVIAYAAELGYAIDEHDLQELDRQAAEALSKQFKKRGQELLSDIESEQSEGMKNLKRFIKLSEENAEVKSKLNELGFSDPSAIINYGKELGYEFTEQDLEQLGNSLLEQSEELSDEELEQVAGGFIDLVTFAACIAAGVVFAVGAVGVGVVGAAVAGAGVVAVGAAVAGATMLVGAVSKG